MDEREEQDRKHDTALRRLAMQLSLQLPVDHGDASRVIGLLVDILEWRDGRPSGREERRMRIRLVSGG
jgi:hypothetical protein